MGTMLRNAMALALLAGATTTAAAQATATWYIATYSNDILVWDEASEQIVDRIRTRHFISTRIQVNAAKTLLYVSEASAQNIEIVDIASLEVIDEFTLSHDSVSVRINGFAPHPSDDKAILFVKRYTKHSDRYTVEGPFILEYDLNTKQVTDTVPWPDDEPRENVSFRYSPDGETLYFFTNDIIAVDATTYEEIDRWEISQPLEPGLGRPSFGSNSGTYDEEGVATSLFRMTDPIQNRRMMGIARVRLSEHELEFFTLGDSQPVGSFTMAPGGKKAYGLYSEIGRYEFWAIDLEEHRVTHREIFEGRPRMGLAVSTNGELLYVHVAGNTIDVYDSETYELLETVDVGGDMRGFILLPGPDAP